MLGKQLRDIESVEAGISLPIVRLFEEAKRELLATIQKGLSGTTATTPFEVSRMRRLLDDLGRGFRIVDSAGVKAATLLQESEPKVAAQAIRYLSESRQEVAALFNTSATPANIAVAEIMTNTPSRYERYYTRGSAFGGAARDSAASALRLSVLKNETFHEATGRLQKAVGPHVSHYTAERFVRTEIMDAYNHYAVEGMGLLEKQDPGWVLRVDASLDSRMCPMCGSLHGKIADVMNAKLFRGSYQKASGDNMVTVHVEAARPPFHPRCRCVVMPWRIAWGEIT